MKSVTRVISFTSGKGGVGKTNTVVNLAICLARLGRRVLILDADLGLANIDVMLGITAESNLNDFFNGHKTLREIMLDGPEGISIIPAASGVESMCSLTAYQKMMLLDGIEEAASDFDYLLIDTQAGISSEVMYFNSASSEIVCLINPEPTSLTDAYALIKILSRSYGEKSISIIANNVGGPRSAAEQEAVTSFSRLSRAVERFLQVQLNYIGHIPADVAVREAIQEQRAVTDIYPSSPCSVAIASIARKLDSDFSARKVKGGMQFFFKQLLEVNAHGN